MELELSKLANELQIGRGIHLSASLFGAIFLTLVWFHAKKEIKKLEQDFGLILLALGLITWVIIDAQKMIFYENLEEMSQGLTGSQVEYKKNQLSLLMKQISAFNNAFFIASLPFFKYGFENLKRRFPSFNNGLNWFIAVIIANVFIVIFYSSNWNSEVGADNKFIEHFDVFYSMCALGVLGYAITSAFKGRKQYGTAFIITSIGITILLVATQLVFSPFVKIVNIDYPALLMYASHVALITLLLVLAQSWVVEEQVNIHKVKVNSLEGKLRQEEKINNELEAVIRDKETKEKALQAEMSELRNELEKRENNQITKSIELSDREKDVIRIIDKSYSEIAKKLRIGLDTVKSHVRNIKNKLGLQDKSQILKYAEENGLLEEVTTSGQS